MRALRILWAVALLLSATTVAFARCGDDAGDAGAVAAARQQVASDCNCAAATQHGLYVRCATDVAKTRAQAGMLPPACVTAVRRCAAKSTCGRPGAATCCRTRAGRTRCSIKRSGTSCRAPEGGSACTSALASCCDACGVGGCVTTTTSTTSTTSSTLPFIACNGGSAFPTCDGACDPGLECGAVSEASQGDCVCLPAGSIPCGPGLFPQCDGGTCPGGLVCGGFELLDPVNGLQAACACVDPASQCASDSSGLCVSIGYCGPGYACLYTPIAPHANCPCCGCVPVNP